MKKIITLSLFSLSFCFFSLAQIHNNSFENWENPLLQNNINSVQIGGFTVYLCANFNYNELEYWSSTNQLTKGQNLGNQELVTASSTAYLGSKSVKIESKELTFNGFLVPGCTGQPVQSISNNVPGLIVNGSFAIDPQSLITDVMNGNGGNAFNPFAYPGVGEAIDFIPKTISGYYQYTGVNGDSCLIVSGLKKNGELIGSVIQRMGNASTWTPFSFEYTHNSCDVPDTIVTAIVSSNLDIRLVNNALTINSNHTGEDGSALFIDALHIDTLPLAEFPPLLANDSATVFLNDSVEIDVLANDIFCDGQTYSPVFLPPIAGLQQVEILPNNKMKYKPQGNTAHTDMVNYYICNNAGFCDTAQVRISVVPQSLCDAKDDNFTIDLSTASTFNLNPKANDSDCGNDIALLGNPLYGSVTLESNNTITYAPNSVFSGVDSFQYYTCNAANASQCDTATIRIEIATNINEIDEKLVQIYPNPANNILHIEVDIENEIQLQLLNVLGQVVVNQKIEKTTSIALQTIPNGLYFAKISANGKHFIQKIQIAH